MNKQKQKLQIKKRRARRTRALLHGTADSPRISVHKSNTHVYIQCINDDIQKTIIGVSTAVKDLRSLKGKERIEKLINRAVALLKEKGISKAIFDRGAYRFHGVVRLIADEFRKNGIRI